MAVLSNNQLALDHTFFQDKRSPSCNAILGQRLIARVFAPQAAELQVRIAVLNGYTTLGILATGSRGISPREKGEQWPTLDLYNRAQQSPSGLQAAILNFRGAATTPAAMMTSPTSDRHRNAFKQEGKEQQAH